MLKRHTAEIPLPESDFKCAEDVLTFPGYHQFRGHYETQQVQHCHMEPPIPGHEVPVPVHRRPHVEGDGVPGAGILKGLLPRNLQPTASPRPISPWSA